MTEENKNKPKVVTEDDVTKEIQKLRERQRSLRRALSVATRMRRQKLEAFVGAWALEHMPNECRARLRQIDPEDQEMKQALTEHWQRVNAKSAENKPFAAQSQIQSKP